YDKLCTMRGKLKDTLADVDAFLVEHGPGDDDLGEMGEAIANGDYNSVDARRTGGNSIVGQGTAVAPTSRLKPGKGNAPPPPPMGTSSYGGKGLDRAELLNRKSDALARFEVMVQVMARKFAEDEHTSLDRTLASSELPAAVKDL